MAKRRNSQPPSSPAPRPPRSPAPQPPGSPTPQPPGILLFLKLGGSLITDKSRPSTPRLDVLKRLAGEIAAARKEDPHLRLILGHGSGSFGHVPAKKYGTRSGVATPEEWLGFTEVWWQASALNRLVVESLQKVELPALSFPVSAGAIGEAGQVANWDISPLVAALDAGLLPIVYGDVVFDRQHGGTIFSTEDIFGYLATELNPERILLAGLEAGVYADYPECNQLISEITPENLAEVAPALRGSAATDVTGGMASKVHQMLRLVEANPGLSVYIFSGESSDNVKNALLGVRYGSQIHNLKSAR